MQWHVHCFVREGIRGSREAVGDVESFNEQVLEGRGNDPGNFDRSRVKRQARHVLRHKLGSCGEDVSGFDVSGETGTGAQRREGERRDIRSH